MNFRTVVDIPRSKLDISYNSNIFSIGSCFATNVGNKLEVCKFKICNNPFGVIFNHASILNCLNPLLEHTANSECDIIERDGLWHSWNLHSSFSSATKDELLHSIENVHLIAQKKLLQANVLLITLGTSWIYRLKTSGEVVANCHKFPEDLFIRERVTTKQIVTDFSEFLHKIQTVNPELEIIFTVSPIRHWKDGAHENQLSKSILLLAVDELGRKFSNVHYFPSYEIVLDELRDYRFYTEDMIHPNKTAIDYIWKRFSETYFSQTTKQDLLKIDKLNKAINHRPFNPNSDEYRAHVSKTIEKCEHLQTALGVDYREDIERLKGNG